MSKKGEIQEVAHGVFSGILLEDMIDTVKRTKQLYCDVEISDYYNGDFGHPLTRVPLWAMSLPLKKGDVVLVEFYQNDLTLPVLYKNPSELPKGYYEKFSIGNFVNGGNISKPDDEDTVGSTWIGDDSYIIKTKNYTILHQNNGFILITKEGKTYVYGSEVNVASTGNVNIDVGKQFAVGNGSESLYTILLGILNILNTNLATQGSPAAHTVIPGQFTAQITQLNKLMRK